MQESYRFTHELMACWIVIFQIVRLHTYLHISYNYYQNKHVSIIAVYWAFNIEEFIPNLVYLWDVLLKQLDYQPLFFFVPFLVIFIFHGEFILIQDILSKIYTHFKPTLLFFFLYLHPFWQCRLFCLFLL